jgi:hypothetical protein
MQAMKHAKEITPEMALAIRDITVQMWSTSNTVSLLARKFGFDVREANRFLSTSIDNQVADQVAVLHKQKDDKSDKPKVKRYKSGYLFYADEVRAKTKTELEAKFSESEQLEKEVTMAIITKWKAESNETKDMWKSRAKAESVDISE